MGDNWWGNMDDEAAAWNKKKWWSTKLQVMKLIRKNLDTYQILLLRNSWLFRPHTTLLTSGDLFLPADFYHFLKSLKCLLFSSPKKNSLRMKRYLFVLFSNSRRHHFSLFLIINNCGGDVHFLPWRPKRPCMNVKRWVMWPPTVSFRRVSSNCSNYTGLFFREHSSQSNQSYSK